MTTRLMPHDFGANLKVLGRTDEDDPLDVIGHLNELRERRISALEEVIAARWPNRWLLALRLRRGLRRSVHSNSRAGQSWHNRRAAWMTDEWLAGHDTEALRDDS